MTKNSVLLLSLLMGCQTDNIEPVDDPIINPNCALDDRVANDAALRAAAANDDFAWDLYNIVQANSDIDDNIFFSPYSITTALGMTMAGAVDDTYTEMATVLYADENEEEHHAGYKELQETVLTDAGGCVTQTHIANRIFAQSGYTWLPDFLDNASINYDAPVEDLDFISDPDGSRVYINDWVADQTEDKILDLLPEGAISSNVRMVLTNAIYFKANWMEQFDESDTGDSPFTLSSGETVTVPMMRRSGSAAMGWSNGITTLELSYDGDFQSMLILLPDNPEELQDIEASLDSAFLTEIKDALQPIDDMDVFIPRFTIEEEISLSQALVSLGMPTAFSASSADFSRMSEELGQGLFIEEVYHKAFIEVDESGSEAAAATAVVVSDESAAPFFYADHPFVFLIQDNATGAILFLGRVSDPS